MSIDRMNDIDDIDESNESSSDDFTSMNDDWYINDHNNNVLKFIIIGDSCVGKSNITLRFAKNEYSSQADTTIGVEYVAKTVCVSNKMYKIQIWDTAGQDTFRSITRTYYRNSIGCIIVYDVSNRESFNNVEQWHTDLIERNNCDNQTIVIVGNKQDIKNRIISYAEGKELADKLGCIFYEASAKTGHNVKKIFFKMVKDIDRKIENNGLTLVSKPKLGLADDAIPSTKGYCWFL